MYYTKNKISMNDCACNTNCVKLHSNYIYYIKVDRITAVHCEYCAYMMQGHSWKSESLK
jgi:hypothetical protein